ncbi:MAG TPA: hypothetical protein DHW64_02070 [Chitinophagaceae bacterium]|nr:hypothetical protein [Chitinophagaceae bacterium]
MKQLLLSYAAYEIWANEQLLNLSIELSAEEQNRPIVSSFPSVHKTFLHMWDASSAWWQRLQMHEQVVMPSLSFHPNMKDIANGLLQQNRQWHAFVHEASDETLSAPMPYKNMKGEHFIQPVFEVVMHLTNHGTYHRGQVITLLRQLGVEKIPQTDYILFTRGK